MLYSCLDLNTVRMFPHTIVLRGGHRAVQGRVRVGLSCVLVGLSRVRVRNLSTLTQPVYLLGLSCRVTFSPCSICFVLRVVEDFLKYAIKNLVYGEI